MYIYTAHCPLLMTLVEQPEDTPAAKGLTCHMKKLCERSRHRNRDLMKNRPGQLISTTLDTWQNKP